MRSGKAKSVQLDPIAWLNSLSHHTGFSTSVDFNKEKVMQEAEMATLGS